MKIKTLFDENDIPQKWYNIQADMPPADPPLNPGTLEPITPDELAILFPKELISQEVSKERWISIPPDVRDIYRLWRPTPPYRAKRLEDALKTPAKIYYKWEGVSPPGSHKPNTAVAQAYYNIKEGCERLRAPTVPIQSKVGAGDSMVAGIVLSLAQGKSPRDAVLFGVAAGAAAAMTPGTELCRREDTERLYRHMVSENA